MVLRYTLNILKRECVNRVKRNAVKRWVWKMIAYDKKK